MVIAHFLVVNHHFSLYSLLRLLYFNFPCSKSFLYSNQTLIHLIKLETHVVNVLNQFCQLLSPRPSTPLICLCLSWKVPHTFLSLTLATDNFNESLLKPSSSYTWYSVFWMILIFTISNIIFFFSGNKLTNSNSSYWYLKLLCPMLSYMMAWHRFLANESWLCPQHSSTLIKQGNHPIMYTINHFLK